MADRAGTLVGIRLNAGPLNVKVTRFDLDFETKHNRSVTTDASQAPRTIITQGGGIIKGTGFIDPSDTANAFLLAAIGAPGTQQDLTVCKYLLDISEAGGSRHGYNIGTAKLVVSGLTGQTDDGGMQEINFEVHASGAITYSSTLT